VDFKRSSIFYFTGTMRATAFMKMKARTCYLDCSNEAPSQTTQINGSRIFTDEHASGNDICTFRWRATNSWMAEQSFFLYSGTLAAPAG
jgi:hypothetical protein